MTQEEPGHGGLAAGKLDTLKVSGSVRRARERIEAGLPSGVTENEGNQHSRNVQEIGQGPNLPGISNPIISRPSPMPQWPMDSEQDNTRKRNNSPEGERLSGKGAAPQRPPRPSYVPSILDTSRLQEQTPVYQYRQPLSYPSQQPQQDANWERNCQLSPSQEYSPFSAGTVHSGTSLTSSRPSTSSSVGSIPDFPVPTIPLMYPLPQTRRGVNLGPPPSSRRGASSYYSQSSYVAPIMEEAAESIKNSHGSFASSHVIPESWGDELPDSYIADEDEGDEGMDGDDGRSSRGTDHDESAGLVRKASWSQRHKPSLTTIKSTDGAEEEHFSGAADDSGRSPSGGTFNPNNVIQAGVAPGASVAMVDLGPPRDGPQFFGSGYLFDQNGFLRPSSPSDGSSTINTVIALSNDGQESNSTPPRRSPDAVPVDPRVRQVLGGLEKGGAINPGTPLPATSPSSESVNLSKRQIRHDSAGLKDVDARGSLTSLPDLIRRATRVASNLDRGRTASRLGLFDLLNANGPKMGLADRSPNRPRSGSLTQMLASFPPPGLATPSSSRHPMSRWTSPLIRHGQESSFADLKAEKPSRQVGRRCCGMPLWAFSLLMMVLAILVAAAIIVPIALIVLPKQNAQNAADSLAASCQSSESCANGGTSIVSGNSCSCVCTNGFSGPNCTAPADTGCTTVDVGISAIHNATIGDSIPRLLSAAASNFSIPLNSTLLLTQFSATNLSCTAENALVSFNGKTQRRNAPLAPRVPDTTGTVTAAAATATASAVTSDGIILALSTTSTTASATATGTGSSASASTTVLPNGQTPITQQDLDFARIAVLYMLQESSLPAAITAQQALQTVLIGNTFQPGSVSVGENVTVDFLLGTVELANGTSVGGRWTTSG